VISLDFVEIVLPVPWRMKLLSGFIDSDFLYHRIYLYNDHRAHRSLLLYPPPRHIGRTTVNDQPFTWACSLELTRKLSLAVYKLSIEFKIIVVSFDIDFLLPKYNDIIYSRTQIRALLETLCDYHREYGVSEFSVFRRLVSSYRKCPVVAPLLLLILRTTLRTHS